MITVRAGAPDAMDARAPYRAHPSAIAVVGNSGSGKTTLCTQLVAELSGRRYRVAVVKHCPHGHDFDRRGSDSQRMFEAGATTSVAFSPDKITRVDRPAPGSLIEELVRELGNEADLVLVEGFKNNELPKILVDDGAPPRVDDVIATVSAPASGTGRLEPPTFPVGLVRALADLVVSQLSLRPPGRDSV